MQFTDIFIRRPVLAAVVSLLILALGLRAITSLQVLQFPKTENAIVTITTTYYGADPDLVAGFITTPLENAVAQAAGIDYLTSTSQSGTSTITANLRLNYDADKALTEINAKVNSVLNQLPTGTQQPVLTIAIGQTSDAMYIAFGSDVLPLNKVTDYVVRVVQPKMQAIPGVQTAEVLGGQNFALRVWLDPTRLAAFGLTASDVSKALADNNYLSGLGNTKGQMIQVNLNASTDLHSAAEFEALVVKQVNGAVIRLKDVARVALGADTYEAEATWQNKRAAFIGIQIAPTANLVDVTNGVKKLFPEIQAQLPKGMSATINFDTSVFVNAAIGEVERTLGEALLIVTLVVFAFLGSLRSLLIPMVAIPLSLIGTFTLMLAFGFSLNLLTLLALVLAIGLVVDDAIIVVENVSRHLEEGMTPLASAIRAARELGAPIIAMTVVLIAVYVPIGFQGGLTGALFIEFAFTLVGAVTVSAVVALTLSPMMSSRLLKPRRPENPGWQDRLGNVIDRRFERLRHGYGRWLHGSLDYLPVTMVFALIMLASIYFLYGYSQSQLAPDEDQGLLIEFATSAPDATVEQRQLYTHQIAQIIDRFPELADFPQFDFPGQSIGFASFKPWNERKKNAAQLLTEMTQATAAVAGKRVAFLSPPSLPGSFGYPVQFVIATTEPFAELDVVARSFVDAAAKSGMFIFQDIDLKLDQPQATLVIDRDKTAELGLDMSDVGGAMASMLGGGYVNYFDLGGRSYRVIPQVEQDERLNVDQVLDYYVKTADGTPVPVSTVAKFASKVVPESLNRFQQLNAATFQAVPFPGVSQGQALAYLQDLAQHLLPQGYTIDYAGLSRQFVQESSGFITTFAFALIIIYLSLAALFESFRDPLIILVSVPMSIAGALIFVSLGVGGASLNIYTQVGLVTLMGLVSKHGILIVEFANDLQRKGLSKRAAIEEASAVRLRPILMTTAAMVLGVVPLLIASGAGAASRFELGLVIASGLTIGTVFTLFVVPAAYLLIAARHKGETEVATPQPG
jgi:multidrug efflux pump